MMQKAFFCQYTACCQHSQLRWQQNWSPQLLLSITTPIFRICAVAGRSANLSHYLCDTLALMHKNAPSTRHSHIVMTHSKPCALYGFQLIIFYKNCQTLLRKMPSKQQKIVIPLIKQVCVGLQIDRNIAAGCTKIMGCICKPHWVFPASFSHVRCCCCETLTTCDRQTTSYSVCGVLAVTGQTDWRTDRRMDARPLHTLYLLDAASGKNTSTQKITSLKSTGRICPIAEIRRPLHKSKHFIHHLGVIDWCIASLFGDIDSLFLVCRLLSLSGLLFRNLTVNTCQSLLVHNIHTRAMGSSLSLVLDISYTQFKWLLKNFHFRVSWPRRIVTA